MRSRISLKKEFNMAFLRHLNELQECEERQFNKIMQKIHNMRSLTKRQKQFFFFNSGAGDTVNEMKNARGSINNRKDQEEFVKQKTGPLKLLEEKEKEKD